jgi:hypothetical protein
MASKENKGRTKTRKYSRGVAKEGKREREREILPRKTKGEPRGGRIREECGKREERESETVPCLTM